MKDTKSQIPSSEGMGVWRGEFQWGFSAVQMESTLQWHRYHENLLAWVKLDFPIHRE